MPAAAVIPAPRAYINVVAVKKPVVGFESKACDGYFASTVDVSLRVGVLLWKWRFIDITYGLWSETCGIVHWPISDTFVCV